MNYVREVINSAELEKILHIPIDFLNQEVEVIVIAKPLIKNDKTTQSMYGILNKYANKDLIKFENTAWTDTLKSKNGNC